MKLHILPGGPIGTNGYLLTDPGRKEALLIDAPGGIWEELKAILEAEGCRLGEIWITHGHWDHLQGAAEIIRETGARVRAHPADRKLIENPRVMSAYADGLKLEPVAIDFTVGQGDRLEFAGTPAEVRHVPGHSAGNVLFYFPRLGAAFVGDALFRGSVGRTDLPGADPAVLARSIREQIYSLPDETAVYSGHGPPTTVAEEKAHNPYVR